MTMKRWLPLLSVAALGGVGLVMSRHAASAPAPARTGGGTMPTLPPESGLSWDVRDVATGAGIPCKLTLIGVDGTATPAFTKNDIGRAEGEAIAAYNRIMSLTGLGVARVPHGTYDIWVSRGPEWEWSAHKKVRVGAGGARLTDRLAHVVDSRGWVSGDFHVHSAASGDSHVPMHHRIYEFLSDGVELLVSTDHNVLSDYAPIIAELGVGKEINSFVGDELTTGSWGHFGAFPLPPDLHRSGHGAVPVHGRSAIELFKEVRTLAPDSVIDVHHPRIDAEIGYFNLGQFDAITDHAGRGGFSYDFDAVEVLNGYQDSERRHLERNILDWFNLLQHGHLVTATGNSDTHHLTYSIGGYPRNYVRVLDDRPATVTGKVVARAIKAHRSFFTTAPFVHLRVDGGELGDTITTRRGEVTVEVDVQAASWVSVSTVTVYLSGKEVKRWPVPASTQQHRLTETFHLPVTGDGWVVARVDGDRTLAPVVGDLTRFDVRPFALTNPVFVDADGNGVYDSPKNPTPIYTAPKPHHRPPEGTP